MKRRKGSSKYANLQRRIKKIANGMAQANEKSPVFILKKGKIKKLTRSEYDELVKEAEGLSYFAGYEIPVGIVIGIASNNASKNQRGKGK